jgi:hypothetical protein
MNNDLFLSSRCASFLSTSCPDAFCTSTVLNTGSSSCVNQIFISVGELVILLPTFGSAWSKKACAHARDGMTKNKIATRLQRNKETLIVFIIIRFHVLVIMANQRVTKNFWPNVVNEYLQLNNHADLVAGRAIDRDYRLGANLKVFAFIEDTGIDRASG